MTRTPSQSYLLRLWREHPGTPMRATIFSVGQPEAQRHFADLDALCTFLRAQASEEPGMNDAWDTPYCTSSESS
jgi:hypothetical protein